MSTRSRTTRAVMTAVAATTLLLAGCGSSATAVSQEQVESRVSEQLTKQVGQKPDKISCPDDLAAKKGTTMRCTLSAGGTSIGLTVTVTSFDGSNVKFDIQVDES